MKRSRKYNKIQYALVAHVFQTPSDYCDYIDSLGKSRACPRCGGAGRQGGSWAAHNDGMCYKCGGTGRTRKAPKLTKRELSKVLGPQFRLAGARA